MKNLLFMLSVGFSTIGQSFLSKPVASQITSDGTTDTQVIQNNNVSTITGGVNSGDNLFHSFQDFSISTGGEAVFNNAPDISNIISRVTGGNISNIDGLISAEGNANLFLINPAGIIFGANARLDIGGSFYGSTADSILFSEGEFSAVNPSNQPTLIINAPIGLNLRDNAAPISLLGSSQSPIDLRVKTGESFNLIGGNLSLTGGDIVAQKGNINLVGLSQAGRIEFNRDKSFNIPDAINRSEIGLDNFKLQILSTPSGGDNGDINITAQTLTLSNGSRLNNVTQGNGNAGNVNISTINSVSIDSNSAIFANTFARGNAGNVTIDAGDNFTLQGINTKISSSVSLDERLSGNLEGSAGNIDIKANNIFISNGATINSNTFGSGNAGNISFNAEAINFSSNSGVFSAVGSKDFNDITTGSAGQIDIQTQTLSLSDGATIIAQTFGEGNAGTININASEAVNISGVANFPFLESGERGGFSSGLFSNSEASASGSGGEITVTTSSLKINDGAVITARSRGNGTAGNIFVSADILEITNGGQLLATAFDKGAAGNISLDIAERINISGIDPDYRNRLDTLIFNFGEQDAQFIIDPVSEASGIFANTSPDSQGDGGNIEIGIFTSTGDNLTLDTTSFTEAITITDRGRIAVDSQGSGNSGTISLRAKEVTLNNEAAIFAETNATSADLASDNIVNIDLQIADSIFLKNDSLISAQAFGMANGGNINIDASNGFVVAFPSQNQGSDILANAQQLGGNITISSQAVFGLDKDKAFDGDAKRLNNRTNDLDASGEVDGFIEIITPNTDVLRGTPKLSDNPVEPQQSIRQACHANGRTAINNTFTIRGRGAILPEPGQPLNSDNVFIDDNLPQTTSSIPQPIETSQGKIQPAMGAIVTETGEVILTAYRTDNLKDIVPEKSTNCL